MLLNEKVVGLKYVLKDECGKFDSHNFCMEVEVDGRTFKGYGKNKKTAKVGAAIAALRTVFKVEIGSDKNDASPAAENSTAKTPAVPASSGESVDKFAVS